MRDYLDSNFPQTKHYYVPGSMLRTLCKSESEPKSLEAIVNIDKITYSNINKLESPKERFSELCKQSESIGLEEYARMEGSMVSALGKELETVTKGAEEVALYIKEESGKIESCIVLSRYPVKLNIIEVIGSFSIADLKNIKPDSFESLADVMDFENMVNFD